MAGTITRIKLTHGNEAAQSIKDEIQAENGDTGEWIKRFSNFLAAMGSGLRAAKVDVTIDDAGTLATDKATQTATFVYATLAADDTEIIGGVTLTCKTDAPANENQYRKQTDLATTIANFAAAINAHSTLSTIVSAAVTAVGVVTLTYKNPGTDGNFFTTRSGVGAGVTWGGVALTGGAVTLRRTYKRGLV